MAVLLATVEGWSAHMSKVALERIFILSLSVFAFKSSKFKMNNFAIRTNFDKLSPKKNNIFGLRVIGKVHSPFPK